MPSREHEMWLELIRQRPVLAAELLKCVRSELIPAFDQARLESGDLSEHAPAAYHADSLVTLSVRDEPALAVIVEVQLRPDRRKHLSWPAYLATARARLGCPAVLLVVCPDATAAAWARMPIRLGHPGLVLTPLVLGPGEVPVVKAWRPGAAPELTVVSAVVHGAGPDGDKVLGAMLDSMESIEFTQARSYIDDVLAVLPGAARKLLEAMMTAGTREYRSDFARRYYGQGIAEGKAAGKAEGKAAGKVEGIAEMVLAVLSARGVVVSDEVRARVVGCTDLGQLELWGRRAATAESVADVFG